jgi:hypothetical protein
MLFYSMFLLVMTIIKQNIYIHSLLCYKVENVCKYGHKEPKHVANNNCTVKVKLSLCLTN